MALHFPVDVWFVEYGRLKEICGFDGILKTSVLIFCLSEFFRKLYILQISYISPVVSCSSSVSLA